MSAERLRFSTAILRLLGEELNPSPDQGILELIKNAYDADATRCTVELSGAHVKGGSIRVWDNGHGMTSEEIRGGWLVVGDSLKSRRNQSPNGRFLVGNKGLGRLGALRLGHRVTLVTRPASEPESEYTVDVDWKRFDAAKVVEDVDLEITRCKRELGATHGTEIKISELPFAWKDTDVHRLARSILLLTDPFQPDGDFRAELKAPEFEEIATRAREGYFSEADFHLIATIDDDGHAKADVTNARGEIIYSAKHEAIADDSTRKTYRCAAATFELWEFLLDVKKFSTKAVGIKAIKEWLREFGGVRLYHRGVRVLPYGDPKNDWLDMNLRRVRNPELRPSTNNSLGIIRAFDPRGLLQQKTDRLGFVENEAFDELRQFAGDVLDWMAGERLREREKRRKSERQKVEQQKRAANDNLQSVVADLPPPIKEKIESAFKKVTSAHDAEVALLTNTAQLYYTLGTVGTTAAAFAHQTKHPLGAIVEDANALEQWLGDPDMLGLFREESSDAVKRIRLEADAIYAFSNVTLKLLEHEKRGSRRHVLHDLITGAVKLLEPYIKIRDATVDYDFSPDNPAIWCSRAALEAIVTNLLTNSLQAFSDAAKREQANGGSKLPSEPRRIVIRTRTAEKRVFLTVADNGCGITGISLDDIWLPGKTTTERGTGLGLSIVRDVVLDLGGSVEAVTHGDLGGAQFTLTFPTKE